MISYLTINKGINVIVGLKVAGDTVQQAEDPGIDKANQILAKLSITKKLLQNDELTPTEKVKVLISATSLLSAGTPVKDENPSDPLSALSDGNLDVFNQATKIINDIAMADGQKLNVTQKQSLNQSIKSALAHTKSELNKSQNIATKRTQELESANIKFRSIKIGSGHNSVSEANAKFEQDLARAKADIIISEIQRMVLLFKELLNDTTKLIEKKKPTQSDFASANSQIKSITTALKHQPKCCF